MIGLGLLGLEMTAQTRKTAIIRAPSPTTNSINSPLVCPALAGRCCFAHRGGRGKGEQSLFAALPETTYYGI